MSIFQMSFSGAILILVIVAIRSIAIHKLPKKTFLIFWCVALFRLLVPFSIPSQFSVYTLASRLTGVLEGATSTQIANADIEILTDVSTIPYSIEPTVTEAAATMQVSPVLIIWFAGMVVCGLFFLINHLRYRVDYKSALPLNNEYVRLWLQEHKIKRHVEVLQSDKIEAPITYGIWKPVILFPKTTDWQNESHIQYILTHELIHISRFDIITKWLLAAALCVHWFNPMVWVMYVFANRDIELSCDVTVVWTFGEEMKSAYALALIELEEKKSMAFPICNGFSKNAIEERINVIMKIKKTSIVGIIAALVLVAGVTTAFATTKLVASNSLLQEATNTTIKQSQKIESFFEAHDIIIESINHSNNAIIEGMDENWEAYDIISNDGDKYLLILRKSDKDFTAILDSDNNLVEGLIDNGVLPKYFEILEKSSPEAEILNETKPHKLIEDNNSLDIIENERNSVPEVDSGGFAWPVPGSWKISSIYGTRVNPFTQEKVFHSGIDIPAPLGTDIVAVSSGVVEKVFTDEKKGKTIILGHDGGLESEFQHCSEISLKEGQPVEKGVVIAKVGSTGNATGSHLHLEIRKDGEYINPLDYFQNTGNPGELTHVQAVPLSKEGTPLANEISSDKAKEIGIAALAKKYSLTQETLDRFTVTLKYFEVTDEAPGKHVWWVNLYPTNTDEFAEIGCYWTYIDAETGEALQLMSDVDGKG